MTDLRDEADGHELFSDVLERLASGSGARLTFAEILEAFGDRAFGAGMTVIGVISLLPWPPGSKVVFSLPLAVIAAEIVLQRRSLWLPAWLLRLSISRATFARGLKRLIRGVRFVEGLSRPRLRALTRGWARTLAGLSCLFLAVMLALPVPFGDVAPALTIIVFGFALMQRDGLLMLVGFLGVVGCAAYLAFIWAAVVEIFRAAAAWVQGRTG